MDPKHTHPLTWVACAGNPAYGTTVLSIKIGVQRVLVARFQRRKKMKLVQIEQQGKLEGVISKL